MTILKYIVLYVVSVKILMCLIQSKIALFPHPTTFVLLLTPWHRFLLEKLTGSQLVIFPAFYGN